MDNQTKEQCQGSVGAKPAKPHMFASHVPKQVRTFIRLTNKKGRVLYIRRDFIESIGERLDDKQGSVVQMNSGVDSYYEVQEDTETIVNFLEVGEYWTKNGK